MQESTMKAVHQLTTDLVTVSAKIRTDTDEVTASGDHIAIIKHYNLVRQVAALVKEAREALKDMDEHLSRVVIPDNVRALRERTGEKPPFNIEGVGRVSIANRFSASIIDDPKLGKLPGINWLKENGHEGLVQETVNAQTLSAFAKTLLEDKGEELPSDIFKVGTSPYTSITKAK